MDTVRTKRNIIITKRIYQNAFPLFISRSIGVLLNVIGISIIAHLGDPILAASTLAFSIFASSGMFIYGVMYSIGIMAAKAYGEKQYILIGKIIRHGAILAVILSFISTLILWNIKPLLYFFHQKAVVIQPTQELLRSFTLRYLPMMLFVLFNQYVIGVGRPKIITVCSIANAIITIPLSYGLTYGYFNLPSMGIWGVGIANSLGSIAQFIIIFVYTLKDSFFKKFSLFSCDNQRIFIKKSPLMEILKTGIPLGLQYIIEISALGVSSFMVGLFSINALVAQQISFQFISLLLLISASISESISLLVGRLIGCKNNKAISQYNRIALLLGFLVTMFLGGIIYLFPSLFIKMYIYPNDNIDSHLTAMTINFLFLSIVTQLFDSVRIILTGTLRGLFDIKIPMFIHGIICWIIALPVSYLFSFGLHWGAVGVKYGWLVAIITGASISYSRYRLLCTKLTI